jgi:predicted transcriptional regulator
MAVSGVAVFAPFARPYGEESKLIRSREDTNMSSAKDAARQIIEHMPEQATWDDIMYELYVKQKIERGLQAAEEGRTVSQEEAKRRLLGDAP